MESMPTQAVVAALSALLAMIVKEPQALEAVNSTTDISLFDVNLAHAEDMVTKDQ